MGCIFEISAKPKNHPLKAINRTRLINYVLWLLGNSNSEENGRQGEDQPFHHKIVTMVVEHLTRGTKTDQTRSFCYILANLTFVKIKYFKSHQILLINKQDEIGINFEKVLM